MGLGGSAVERGSSRHVGMDGAGTHRCVGGAAAPPATPPDPGHTLHPKPTTLRRPRTPHASTTHRQQCWPGRGSLVQERRHPESGSAQPPGSEVKTPVLCAHACAPVPPPPPTLTARAGSEAPPSARIRQSSTQDGGDQDSGEEPRQPAVEPPDLASQMRARVNAARERSTRPRDTPPADPHPGPAPASRGEEEQLDRKRAEGSASEGGEDPPGGGDGRGSSGGRDATAGGGAGGPGSRPHDGKPDYAAERRAELQSQREDDSLQRTYGRARVTSEVTDADLLKPWQVRVVVGAGGGSRDRLRRGPAPLYDALHPYPAPSPCGSWCRIGFGWGSCLAHLDHDLPASTWESRRWSMMPRDSAVPCGVLGLFIVACCCGVLRR